MTKVVLQVFSMTNCRLKPHYIEYKFLVEPLHDDIHAGVFDFSGQSTGQSYDLR